MFSLPELPADPFIVILLAIAILLCLRKIKDLKSSLDAEHKSRSVPLIILDVDPQDKILYLKNDSECFAKDIQISDLDVELSYDFKKVLTIKFDKVDFLKPQQKTRLNYELYEKGHLIKIEVTDTLFAHLDRASFEINVRFSNLENTPFLMTVEKSKERFSLKEIRPLGRVAN